jgi:polysaccharide chain length determinant protein (PEP-CTERM system associated)
MMQQLNDLLERLSGLWRFRWIGMGVAWAVFLLGLIVITVLPDRYEASATVFVDTQTVLSAATRTLTVDSNTDAQIQGVREALLGGPQLAKIADDTGLTAQARSPEERQSLLEKLRKQIQINGALSGQNAGTGNGGAGTYVISFMNKDRQTSLKVVDRFVTTFVHEAQGGKHEGSVQAQQFLTQQIAEIEKRLRDSEETLATFKKEHVGLLPGSQTDYFNRLDTELADLDAAQTKLSLAVTRRNELQRQLNGEEPLVANSAGRNGTGSGAPLSGTAMRLQQSQQQLDELLLNFTDKHPRVIELRATIAELQKRLAEEMEAARHGDAKAAASTGLAASPVYQNMQVQKNEVDLEVAGLQADVDNRRQRVAQMRSMMNTAPEVEAQYSRLNRDYGVVKAQYEALVDQLGRARLGEQAAQTGVIRFDVVDPPRANLDPVFPKRILLAIGALVVAVAAGLGTAFLLSLLRPVYGSVRTLREITGLPVLGEVSMTWLERHEAWRRRSTLRLAGSFLVLMVIFGVFLVTQRYLANAVRTWMA